MTETRPRTAPKHLRLPTKRWWLSVVTTWTLEDHHVRLLTLAGQAWDRAEAAREVIQREGLTYRSRLGEPRAHPAVAVERDAVIAFTRLVRELDLDIEAPPSGPRPPRLPSNREG